MSSLITIPAAVIPRLREGAKTLLRTLGEHLEHAADDPPTFREQYERLQSVWGPLDAIGWNDKDDHADIEVDLRKHGTALLSAVDDILPMLAEWLAELPEEDQGKPARTEEYRLVRQFRMTVRQKITRLEQNQ